MADVFLSYSRQDLPLVRKLVMALETRGLAVWWDLSIPAGAVWASVIEDALESSRVIVVLWSSHSVKSEWVRAEAARAADLGKLIPAVLEDVQLPLGFSQYQYVDLSTWDGSSNAPPFLALIRGIASFTERDHAERPPQPDSPGDRVLVDTARPYKALHRASRIKLFIAHASADKPKLRPTVKVLIDQGFQLWVDKPQEIGLGRAYENRLSRDRIQYGHDWRESIRVAVKRASVVLAFWSEDAVRGRREQFHYEVYMGMMQNKLNQCRIDKVPLDEIGMPYTFDQIADLAEIEEGKYYPELDYLMQDIVARHRSWWFV